jgi:hypothetical protein
MTKTQSNAIGGAGWDVSFWFAVLSPVLGFWSLFSPCSSSTTDDRKKMNRLEKGKWTMTLRQGLSLKRESQLLLQWDGKISRSRYGCGAWTL